MNKNVALMIVPTGIGASIGGYAGDASKYAQKVARNMTLIVNPNTVNAAVFSGITDNMLYVEGWAIEQFVKGNIGLLPSQNNKIGIIFDKAIPQEVLNIHINTINAIYKDVKKKSLVQISKRYQDSKFLNYNYLGNVKGYDVFDESEFCELEKQYLFSYFNSNYYLNCASLDDILLYKGKEKITIKEALEKEILIPADFMNSVIDLYN